MITIIDYGVGNLASVQNMLNKCGYKSTVTSDPEKIRQADKLILPGVGAYDSAMQKILDLNLKAAILEAAKKGTLTLGICLGSQLLFDGSDEGLMGGLSLIKGTCKKFEPQKIAPLRVPHMGWSDVSFKSHPIANFAGIEPRFYFAHSYFFQCEQQEDVLATCTYGLEFACGVSRENIMGLQFHPEKSHMFGARLLTNFGKM
jgi:glutamine amidotransferase